MHREARPPLGRRLRRSAPFVAGGVAVLLLLTAALGIRTAALNREPSTEPAPDTTAQAEATTVSSAATDAAQPDATGDAAVSDTTPADTGATVPADVTLSDTPGYGGLISVGLVGEPTTLNPFEPDGAVASLRAIGRAVWVGALTRDAETLEPVPQVAIEIPSEQNGGIERNEDGTMTIRYRINPQARWSDGTPITGDDFVRTYEIATSAAGVADEIRTDYARIVRGSLEADGARVAFTLREPSSDISSLFSILVPAHEVSVSGFSSAWDFEMWPSGGPFQFLTWERGTGLRLVANSNSWAFDAEADNPLPYLDGIRFTFFATAEDLAAALRSGEVEVGAPDIEPVDLAEMEGRPSLSVDMRYGPEWEHIAFQFGSGRDSVNDVSFIDDVDLRRAIAHLLDRSALAQEIQGRYGRALESVVGLAWPSAATDAWAVYDHNPAAAAELLDNVRDRIASERSADTEDGDTDDGDTSDGPEVEIVVAFTTTANDPDREVIARHLVDALESAGIRVDVTLSELGAYFRDQVIPGNFEIAEWAWRAAPGPAGVLNDLSDHHLVGWPDGLDFYEWGASPEDSIEAAALAAFAAELDAVVGELNRDILEDAARSAEAILVDRVVMIPLYAELNPAIVSEVVGGFSHSSLTGGETSTIGGWWRRDR